jgi:hypothetical protein
MIPFVAASALLLLVPERARAQDAVEAESPRDPDLEADMPSVPHLLVRSSAGMTTRALFDSLVLGGEADVGVGVDTRVGSFSLVGGFFAGTVEGGLMTLHGYAGIDCAWSIGIVRLGLRPRVGYLGIDRITNERQFGAYTFGGALRVSVDLFREDAVAFALGLEPSADVAAALGNDGASRDSAAPLVGGRGFLEVRWRSPGLEQRPPGQ